MLSQGSEEQISKEDECPICTNLMYDPVVTSCNHTMCKSCLVTWADTIMSENVVITSVDEMPVAFDPSEIEVRCPMCRSQTAARTDLQRVKTLKDQYPQTYQQREADEKQLDDGDAKKIETMTLYVGNKHRHVSPKQGRSSNVHEWTYFVRPSRTDLVSKVIMDLHPTFNPSRLEFDAPPYQIRRLGWGYFDVRATVILKDGYCFMHVQPDSQTPTKRMLRLSWTLDFDSYGGAGSMGRFRLKLRKETPEELERWRQGNAEERNIASMQEMELDEDDGEDDEDFAEDSDEDEVAEEYDSNVEDSERDGSGDEGSPRTNDSRTYTGLRR